MEGSMFEMGMRLVKASPNKHAAFLRIYKHETKEEIPCESLDNHKSRESNLAFLSEKFIIH
jgi:hypothetical protein